MEFNPTGHVGKCRALKAISLTGLCAIENPVKHLGEPGVLHITGSLLNIAKWKGRGQSLLGDNCIRLDPSEPNLPAWVPRLQGL